MSLKNFLISAFFAVLGLCVSCSNSGGGGLGPSGGAVSSAPCGYEIGSPAGGTGNGQFSSPFGVAVDPSGNIFVADTNNHRIQKISGVDGSFLAKFGSFGTGNGQFNGPRGLAVDSSGNLYVADSGNNRVQIFNNSGNYVNQFGGFGSGNGQFNFPWGVALDSSGNIYVTDYYNNRLQEFTGAGVFLTAYGSYGNTTPAPNGKFFLPAGVAVDSTGNVYIADSQNSRIEVLKPSGASFAFSSNVPCNLSCLSYTASASVAGSGLLNPYGVVLGPGGVIYVADTGHSVIQKFVSSTTGLCSQSVGLGCSTSLFDYMAKAGQSGLAAGAYTNPYSLALDASGNLLVADTTNNRVYKSCPF
jgi:sugar lactone lactonase YvrE